MTAPFGHGIIIVAACRRLKVRPKAPPERSETEKSRCNMYAVFTTGGKQYRVAPGDVIFVEKLDAEVESTVEFDQVLAVSKDEGTVVGAPTVEGAKVEAKVLRNGKAKKITVFTYRPKKDSKRKMGHRQPYTKLEITAINA